MLRGRFLVARLARDARHSVQRRSTLRNAGQGRLVQGVRGAPRFKSTLAATAADALPTTAAQAIPYKSLGTWVLGCGGMVFGMVVVGGTTRLTRSGLSMTDWRPQGRLPPMNLAEWEVEFDKYRDFPEFKRLNMSMTLDEFKSIYYWEWGHRMWGRAIGVCFAAPLVYFAARRQIPRHLYGRLGLLFGMGGMQGAIGWWMVKSGLDHEHIFGIQRSEHDTPRVSPYRLTTHLSMAFATYGLLLWTGLDLLRKSADARGGAAAQAVVDSEANLLAKPELARALRRLRGTSKVATVALGVTILSGAFVAGNDAGRAYNDFPLMAGRWIPEEIWDASLGIRNFFENTATVQFDHRVLATTTGLSVGAVALAARRPALLWASLPVPAKTAVMAMVGVTASQYALGVTALMTYVPVHLGVAHQAGALSTWTAAVYLLHGLRYLK